MLTLIVLTVSRKMSKHLFNNELEEYLNYDLILTIVFSNPSISQYH